MKFPVKEFNSGGPHGSHHGNRAKRVSHIDLRSMGEYAVQPFPD
jgi:hypothetical protein